MAKSSIGAVLPLPIRPRSPTVQTLARAAGVHPSTVARALDPAQRHRISPEVVAKVEEEAARQGYRRNAGAAALRTGRSRLVGVVLPDLTNPVFPPILSGIAASLARSAYTMLVADGSLNEPSQERTLEELIVRRIDGLILASVVRSDPLVDLCLRSGVPTVLVNRREDIARTSSVVSDDARGMELAVEHLLALGHRRIGHVAGRQDLSTGERRRGGFEQAMAAAGLAGSDVEVSAAYSIEAGRIAAAAMLDVRPDITAVVAANDLLAIGVCRTLSDRGIHCPREVSVTGHNDMPFVDILSPPLTTVRIEHAAMGNEAARLLMNIVADGATPITSLMTTPELVVRRSTAPPREYRSSDRLVGRTRRAGG